MFERHTHVSNTKNRDNPKILAWIFVTDGDHLQTGLNPTDAGGHETSQLNRIFAQK
jgi:hypothetical protein